MPNRRHVARLATVALLPSEIILPLLLDNKKKKIVRHFYFSNEKIC